MKKIIVIQYKRLETLHPVMTLLLSLKQLGLSIHYIGVESNAAIDFLAQHDISHSFIPFNQNLYENNTILTKVTHRIARAFRFFMCRRWLREEVKRITSGEDAVIMWFVCVNSAALLGNAFNKYRKRIVSIYELGEDYGKHWLGFSFAKFISTSLVVVPEYNRAYITKAKYNLIDYPLVVHNRPYRCETSCSDALPSAISGILKQIGGRPVFLYQGVWVEDRVEVGKVLETIARYRPNYAVLVMPGNQSVEKLLSPYENAFILPYIPPPRHLLVTQFATVGIAIYTSKSRSLLGRLNPIYCAPNKIYEYAGFGIPTLGNNIPGLHYTVEINGAGVCCELTEESILRAADTLIENIDKYREGARRFFQNTDVVAEIGRVIAKVENQT